MRELRVGLQEVLDLDLGDDNTETLEEVELLENLLNVRVSVDEGGGVVEEEGLHDWLVPGEDAHSRRGV